MHLNGRICFRAVLYVLHLEMTMNMPRLNSVLRPAMLILGVGTCACIAGGQSVVRAEKIIAVGDTPSWAHSGSVTALDTPVVSTDGIVGFNGTIDPDGISHAFVFREGFPTFIDFDAAPRYILSGRETTMGVGPGGTFIYSPSIANGSFNNDGLWSSSGYIISTRDPAPGISGKFIKFASGPRLLGNNVFMFMAGFSNVAGGTTTDRALYRGTLGVPGLTLIYKTGDVIAGETIRFATPTLSFRFDASDHAQHIIHLAGVGAGTTKVLMDGAWIAQPGDVLPGSVYADEAWDNFTGVGVNNSGQWMIFGQSANFDDTSSNDFVAFNGVSTAHENDTIDGVRLTAPSSVRVAALNNLGDVVHMWMLGTGTSATKALFIGPGSALGTSRLVARTGDLLDFDGDGVGDYRIYDLPESVVAGPGIDLGDDGRIVTRVTLENAAGGGTRFDAIERFCYANCTSACPTCAADFNQDGGVDGADIEAFFTAWSNGDSCGDVNTDGGVDGSDIESFFSYWENGGC